jgi:hypothetical protein
MVFERVPAAIANPPTTRPIWLRKGSAMSDHSTIPTDGNTMPKFYSDTSEGSPIWSISMQIWHNKKPVGATATDPFSPNTETLGSIMYIKM